MGPGGRWSLGDDLSPGTPPPRIVLPFFLRSPHPAHASGIMLKGEHGVRVEMLYTWTVG